MKINRLFLQFLLISVLTLGLQASVQAQSPTPYGNEWIDYNKTYYKLKVVNTGLHRLSHGFLDSLGLAGTNPQHFQLFRRGKEVAIHVAGEADGRLDREDFIEFYGERNDGRLDQDLYKNPAHQPHQLYSLYTDTAAYFLTVNPAGGKRMQEVNPSPAGKTPEPYVLRKVTQYFVDRYYDGKIYGTTKSQLSWIDTGEGFTATGSASAKNYNLASVTGVVPTGPKPLVKFNLIGVSAATQTGLINVMPAVGGAREVSSFMFGAFGHQHVKSHIEFSDILADGRVTFRVVPNAVQKSNVSMSNIELTFPQKTELTTNSVLFYTDSTRAANPYYEVGLAPVATFAYDVSDSYSPVRIEGRVSGNGKGFVIPTRSGASSKVLVANSAKALKPTGKTEHIRFRRIVPSSHNYIILTNKRLMKVAAGTQRPAPLEYASYRASSVGGGYDTLLVYMDQVVDQFHYGEFSSNAIRKFMTYLQTSDRSKYLFIIGKGMKYAHADYRSIQDAHWTGAHNRYSFYHIDGRHPKVHEMDLVPTGMLPASDVFFTSDFRNNRFEPKVPTGRLPATSAENIIAYLNKVKEHEALPEGLAWRKNILQLGGGSGSTQINQFKRWLNEHKVVAEGPLFGGNVIEKYRFDSSQPTAYVNVSEEVNAGLSLITFYGHSSVDVSDIEIGFASANLNGYRNKGKYPAILMNGCYSGDAFFYRSVSFGEDWLITPDRGAISFMAQSYIGGDEPLNRFSKEFYHLAFTDNNYYGHTIGDIHKETIRRYSNSITSFNNEEYITTMTQMVLQGDPAVKLYAPSKPDYAYYNNNYSLKELSGAAPTAVSKNYVLRVNVINLGKAISDSLSVSIKRILPSGKELTPVLQKVKPIYNREQIEIVLPNTDSTGIGINKFEIILDATSQFDELNEDNNSLIIRHFLPSSGISLLAPMEFSIVNSQSVDLFVQSTQLRAEPKGVYFELDTISTFTSAIKKTYSTQAGVVPTWKVDLPIQNLDNDSTVFFWRARFDSFEAEEDTVWVMSSFRYVKDNAGGWSQSHPDQIIKSDLDKIEVDDRGKLNFGVISRNIEIRAVGGDRRFDTTPYGIYIDGISEVDNSCGNFKGSSAPRMYFYVLDNKTLELTTVPGFAPCRWMSNNTYDFGNLDNATVRATMQRFMEAIPTGQHVVVMGINRVPFDQFSPELKAAFRSLGSELIDNISTGYPFAMVSQKGAATGTANEVSADLGSNIAPTSQEVMLVTKLQTYNTQGSITSTLIGPALSWGSLHHNIERYKAGNDSYKLKLFGIGADGARELLNDNIPAKAFDLSQVDAAKYPHLQLQAELSDTEDRSAPQLRQWMVYYQATPEGVIRPDLVEVNDEIIEQQANRGRVTMPMAFQNVTPYAFKDSITVEVTLTGEGIEPRVSRFKIEALGGNKTATFNYTMSTADLDGNYRLLMYVNPQLQPEQQYQNNIYEVNFGVKSKLHPIMDVAFDGVHIMDGELVSPSPLISITMKDENKHVFLENADAMEVYLEGTNIQGQYDVKKEAKASELRVSPADEKNDFRFEYKPERLETGTYTLTVRGRDASGKSAGSDYKINFEVDNESKITNFYPYPNPFSTKTQFIFTLTGGVIPSDFKIQIMTVTGKIVKEIMREEIGPIRIGNNKTEYAWDGTDMYGDKLANGVYLYRVVMPKDAEEMKHIWKKGDKGFVNGYGKVYILR
ncbi:interleukin-like EMT inducer protein [Pontibacter ramchanderi]|uniref:Interleukin-like EMT inducer protein n=2 Tax=Pontibacter ramchanderi TaxID=1179743 RepID=A0A2N3V427_9BACT|nr:interleukin-like EMT inducer protein [Pontibacter ramchanderi]